jgi:mannose-6-phosphate isomerase-like protein (cupin superfamily)
MSGPGLVGVPLDQGASQKESFARDGFVGPLKLLTKQQAVFLGRHLLLARERGPVWEKSLAAVDPLVHEIAVNAVLLHRLRDLIGDDIILWGASVVVRRPGEMHPWHCDIESSAPDGGFVSVWIGLLNTQKRSSLLLMSGSHTYGVTLQEAAAHAGVLRKDRTDEVVSRLAQSQSPGAAIVQPETSDGEAILFDGRVWHGSNNDVDGPPRVALLLQYARADITVKVPDLRNLDWPFQYKDERPPAVAVSGHGDPSRNRLVRPPAMRQPDALAASVHPIDPSSRCEDGRSFTPVHCFLGRTDNVDYLESHYSILMPGFSPHPPHAHLDEELLVVMSGAAELVVADSARDGNPKIVAAPAGTAIYYPPYQHHTIRNASSEPVRYAMLRWRSPAISANNHLPSRFVPAKWREADIFRGPVSMRTLFEGPSAFLGKLHGHVTRVLPDGGYEAHRDAHDVSIFLIEGEIAVLGKNIVAPAVVFIPAGHLHGMNNVGSDPAKYIVWEFHREAERAPEEIRVPVQAPVEAGA